MSIVVCSGEPFLEKMPKIKKYTLFENGDVLKFQKCQFSKNLNFKNPGEFKFSKNVWVVPFSTNPLDSFFPEIPGSHFPKHAGGYFFRKHKVF